MSLVAGGSVQLTLYIGDIESTFLFSTTREANLRALIATDRSVFLRSLELIKLHEAATAESSGMLIEDFQDAHDDDETLRAPLNLGTMRLLMDLLSGEDDGTIQNKINSHARFGAFIQRQGLFYRTRPAKPCDSLVLFRRSNTASAECGFIEKIFLYEHTPESTKTYIEISMLSRVDGDQVVDPFLPFGMGFLVQPEPHPPNLVLVEISCIICPMIQTPMRIRVSNDHLDVIHVLPYKLVSWLKLEC